MENQGHLRTQPAVRTYSQVVAQPPIHPQNKNHIKNQKNQKNHNPRKSKKSIKERIAAIWKKVPVLSLPSVWIPIPYTVANRVDLLGQHIWNIFKDEYVKFNNPVAKKLEKNIFALSSQRSLDNNHFLLTTLHSAG